MDAVIDPVDVDLASIILDWYFADCDWTIDMTIAQIRRVRKRMANDKRYKTALRNKGRLDSLAVGKKK